MDIDGKEHRTLATKIAFTVIEESDAAPPQAWSAPYTHEVTDDRPRPEADDVILLSHLDGTGAHSVRVIRIDVDGLLYVRRVET